MRSGICASVSTTGWISVCVPSSLCGSGSCDRSSSAGVLIAPPAAMKCRALIVTVAAGRAAVVAQRLADGAA